MRHLTDHVISPQDPLKVQVEDKPGQGGAHHRYAVSGFDVSQNPSVRTEPSVDISPGKQIILFQNGPVHEFGHNGITNEALLAIVADRLRSFQAGQFASRDNACALTHVEEALMWLHQRTLKRVQLGVEGTSVA